MASLADAFVVNTPKESHENPQAYDEEQIFVQHVKEARHELGLVAGNAVSRIAGIQVDLESDLKGITRANSDSTARHHLPPKGETIVRKDPKTSLEINAALVPIKDYQQWAYPSVIGPLPLEKQICHRPEKY
jgi:hypothetical protein